MRLIKRPTHKILARLIALCASSAIVVAGLSVAPTAHAVGVPSPPAQAGALWLERNLEEGGKLKNNEHEPFTNYDASVDAALAFAQIPGHEARQAQILAAIKPEVDSYIVEKVFNEDDEVIGEVHPVGKMAKYAVLTARVGGAAVDDDFWTLIEQIKARIATNEPIVGRAQDQLVDLLEEQPVDIDFTLNEDKANVVDQAWVVEALRRADALNKADNNVPADPSLDDLADKALTFLAKQQCTAGYFREKFTADKAQNDQPNDQSCVQSKLEPDYSPPNNRTTGQVLVVLQSLKEAPGVDAGNKVQGALNLGRDWFMDDGQQTGRGGFKETEESAKPDSVTTALAGLALAKEGGRALPAVDRVQEAVAKARLAAGFVRGLQAHDPSICVSKLTDDKGAIALSQEALDEAKDVFIGTTFSWRSATARALPVLQLVPRTAGPPTISGPTGYVRSGATIRFRIANLEVGERVCLAGYKLPRRIPSTQTVQTTDVNAPAGTANRTYNLVSMEGTRSFVLHVLDGKRLKIKAKLKAIKRNATQSVVVSGLAPGERVRVVIKGKTVAKGKANARGKFKKKFKVKAPKGQTNLKVWGQFNNRHGQTKFTVR